MINPRELRIGNLLQIKDGKIITVSRIDIIDIEFLYIENGFDKYGILSKGHFDAIPITEEWLIKFGFEKNKSSIIINYDKERIRIKKAGTVYSFSFHAGWIEIKYIHQLQNLYLALTGNELEIK